MDLSFLQNKTNDEIYSIITGLTRASLSKALKNMSKMTKKQQKHYKGMILFYIPGGMKIQGIKAVELIKEYISNYDPASGDSAPDALITLINERLQSAKAKIDAGKEDELTDEEKNALAADENKDGQITTTQLTDDSGEPLNSSDEKNSEIQVFE